MGLFDKVFAQVTGNNDYEIQRGFVQVCVAASGADGVIDDEEFATIVSYISRMKMFADMKDSEINKIFQKSVGMLRTKGALSLLDGCEEVIPDDLKNTAFACACDIALSDGVLESEEQEILEHIYRKLGVDENQAVSIMEVILIKNKL